jgi:hypothetical protein
MHEKRPNEFASTPKEPRRHTRRIPTQSLFYDRLLPVIFIILGIVMLTLIVIATGVLLGVVRYS